MLYMEKLLNIMFYVICLSEEALICSNMEIKPCRYGLHAITQNSTVRRLEVSTQVGIRRLECSSLRQVEDPLGSTRSPCQQYTSSKNVLADCCNGPRAEVDIAFQEDTVEAASQTVADESAWKVIQL